jgi:DNA-binding NarL/FixJ family response regulator
MDGKRQGVGDAEHGDEDGEGQQSVPVAELSFLTDREREVTALVAEGLSNGEIAERLFVSAATVKTHVSRSMTKLQARDRAQLVVMAYESGLVRPGWLAT